MDRNRMATGLTIAFVVALLFSLYMYRTIRRITAVKPATTRQIVVANRPVQLGTRLDATNLRLISWPACGAYELGRKRACPGGQASA
jgi:Flp pilus assembly protein CpaB